MQINTTRHHYTAIRVAKFRTLTSPKVGENVEQRNSHTLLVEMKKNAATLRDSLVISQDS